MTLLGVIIFWICQIFIFILLGRVILDFVRIFARDWYPTGLLLVVANFVYRITDPPLRFLNRFIPPLRLGGIALDLGFIVLLIAVNIVQRLVLLL